MKLRHVFYLLLGLVLFSRLCLMNNTDESNLYVIHTSSGNIQCNYHNSRDLNNGWMVYYDRITKEQKHIEYWMVDSITIYNEYWLTCGPSDKKMKYIDMRDGKH